MFKRMLSSWRRKESAPPASPADVLGPEVFEEAWRWAQEYLASMWEIVHVSTIDGQYFAEIINADGVYGREPLSEEEAQTALMFMNMGLPVSIRPHMGEQNV